MNKPLLAVILLFPILIALVLIFANNKAAKTQTSDVNISDDKNQSLPPIQVDKNKKYTAVLNTTEGKILIELNVSQVPITVNNFVSLSKKGFYNNTIFHRVINNFMIQGGDPAGDGSGGPGYTFSDEPFEGNYTRGTVAMANRGPNTNGSQFFIIQKDQDLPKNYVKFGRVAEGIEVVDKIAEGEVTTNYGGEKSKPVNPVKIESVEIIESE